MSISKIIVHQVYDDSGYFITVRPWPDVPGTVLLTTVGDDNVDYFGDHEIAMSPQFAKLLGEALIACSEEVE